MEETRKLKIIIRLLTQASEKFLILWNVMINCLYLYVSLFIVFSSIFRVRSFQIVKLLLIQWLSSINTVSFNKWIWEPFLLAFNAVKPTATLEGTMQNTEDVLFILTVSRAISLIWSINLGNGNRISEGKLKWWLKGYINKEGEKRTSDNGLRKNRWGQMY